MVKFADGGNNKKKLQYHNLPWLTGHDTDVCDVVTVTALIVVIVSIYMYSVHQKILNFSGIFSSTADNFYLKFHAYCVLVFMLNYTILLIISTKLCHIKFR